MEDRLNPITPEGVDEGTFGGYQAVHGRAPAFEGSDGLAYTAAVEVDQGEGETPSWTAYFVFLRWAETGGAIMGHLETDDVVRASSRDGVERAIGLLALPEVKRLLDGAIEEKRALEAEAQAGGTAEDAADE